MKKAKRILCIRIIAAAAALALISGCGHKTDSISSDVPTESTAAQETADSAVSKAVSSVLSVASDTELSDSSQTDSQLTETSSAEIPSAESSASSSEIVISFAASSETTSEEDAAIEVKTASIVEEEPYSIEQEQDNGSPEETDPDNPDTSPASKEAAEIRSQLNIQPQIYSSFCHGIKTAEYQKYIVIHDTEEQHDPYGIVQMWLGRNGGEVATHFVVGRDGTIVQCLPLDQIAYHVGGGDPGTDAKFGVYDDGRDEYSSGGIDIGMNSWSVGIELCHVGSPDMGYPVETEYPEAQLEALDKLIAYIDAYYGFESDIICHKEWRSSNSDTSAEFEPYLENYKAMRTHE